MSYKVIIASSVNVPEVAAEQANKELGELGEGWEIVSAVTTSTVFGVDEKSREQPPVHHAVYTATIVLKKND